MSSKFEQFILAEQICHSNLEMGLSINEYAMDLIIPVDEEAIRESVEAEFAPEGEVIVTIKESIENEDSENITESFELAFSSDSEVSKVSGKVDKDQVDSIVYKITNNATFTQGEMARLLAQAVTPGAVAQVESIRQEIVKAIQNNKHFMTNHEVINWLNDTFKKEVDEKRKVMKEEVENLEFQNKNFTEMLDENGCLTLYTSISEESDEIVEEKLKFIVEEKEEQPKKERAYKVIPAFVNKEFVKCAKSSNYGMSKKKLTLMVKQCKTIDCTKTLDKDLTALINYLKEKEVMITGVAQNDAINEFIGWLRETGRLLIKDRRDALKEKGVQESYAAKVYKYDDEDECIVEAVVVIQESDIDSLLEEGWDFDNMIAIFENKYSGKAETGIENLINAINGMNGKQLTKFKAKMPEKIKKLEFKKAKASRKGKIEKVALFDELLKFYRTKAQTLINTRERKLATIKEAQELNLDIKEEVINLSESSIELIDTVSAEDSVQDAITMALKQDDAEDLEQEPPTPILPSDVDPVANPVKEEADPTQEPEVPAHPETKEEPVEEGCDGSKGKGKPKTEAKDDQKDNDDFEDYIPKDADNDGVEDEKDQKEKTSKEDKQDPKEDDDPEEKKEKESGTDDDKDEKEDECTGEDECQCEACKKEAERKKKIKAAKKSK